MSNSLQQVTDWLTEISHYENKELSLNENGECYLESESGHTLIMQTPENGEFLYLTVLFKSPLHKYNKNTFEEILKFNMFQEKTRGGVIAIDNLAGSLVLNYRSSLEMLNALSLNNLIGNMFSTAIEIEDELNQELENDNKEHYHGRQTNFITFA